MALTTQQLRLVIRLGIGLAGVILLLFLAVRLYGFPEELIDLPLFVAPMLTIFVASFALGDFALDLFQDEELKKEPRDRAMLLVAVSAIVWALSLGVCFMLVSFTSWYEHLVWLGTLFAIFIGWDFFVLSYLSKVNDSHRERIAWGNRIVNRPTIGALLFALLFLGVLTSLENHAAEVAASPSGTAGGTIADAESPVGNETVENAEGQLRNNVRRPQEVCLGVFIKLKSHASEVTASPSETAEGGIADRESPVGNETVEKPQGHGRGNVRKMQDVFVTGLIFFHLFAAACGYLATFFMEIKDSGKVAKVGYYLFYWTPQGAG